MKLGKLWKIAMSVGLFYLGSSNPSFAGKQEVETAATTLANAYVQLNFPVIDSLLADDMVFSVGQGFDFPYAGITIGKPAFYAIFNQLQSIATAGFQPGFDVAANDTTAYVRIHETGTWNLTNRTIDDDVIWALKFKKVGGKLKVVKFDYWYRDNRIVNGS